MDNLVAFWNFQEPAGEPRQGARGSAPVSLREFLMAVPMARASQWVQCTVVVSGGIFFDGHIGGLAVFDRALTEPDLANLAEVLR